ncbi:MAG: hypothetical protein R3D44_12095 [Hyphomicrobiaceae bacterium]
MPTPNDEAGTGRQEATTGGSGATTITPNEAFRRVRKVYVGCIVLALPLLFLALYTAVEHIGDPVLPIILLVGGVGLLIFAMMTRAAAACPRCSASLIWKKGPIGTGRLSLREKARCPNCGLDLNAPWTLDEGEAAAIDGMEQSR